MSGPWPRLPDWQIEDPCLFESPPVAFQSWTGKKLVVILATGEWLWG